MQTRYTGTALSVRTPADFDLPRDVCSYGYFVLAPNRWDVESQTLRRALELTGGPAGVDLAQPGGAGTAIKAKFDRTLDRADQIEAKAQIARMLRLDESEAELAAFHAIDSRWKVSGRGRLFRSPTLFEDIIKTVTSCNVAWTSTITMNERLCVVCGRKTPGGWFAFPRPERVARTRPGTLRGRCRVGYRDQRIVDLAKLCARGEIDEAWLTNPATDDDAVFEFLKSLPGIGPYAAGNIMQLLGRYARLAFDSESARHGRAVLGYEEEGIALTKRLAAHYEPFGRHRFRSYWFELWDYYESKRGPAHLWDRDTTGRTFTAAQL